MHGWHGCSCKQLSFFLSFSPSLFLFLFLFLCLSLFQQDLPNKCKSHRNMRQANLKEKAAGRMSIHKMPTRNISPFQSWRLVPGSRQVGSQPPFAATQMLTKFQVLPLASATQRPSGHSLQTLQTGINDHCISPTVDSLQAPERLGNSNSILHLQHWSILLTSNAQMRQH